MNETRWVRAVAITPAMAVASFGAVGLVLADAGQYRPILVYPVGLIVWLLLLRAVRPVIRAPAATDRASRLAGGGAVVLAAGIGCWNALHASQHVLTDRDPAIYNNAARWIARYGNLEFTARTGPFGISPFGVAAPGVLPVAGRQDLQFQSPHLLPALLAEMRGIGGDHLMFMLPAVLGAFALLAFFVVASRVVHNPFGALAATACLALAMPEVFISRDSYSEIATQVLVFTALWLLCDESILRQRGPAFVAGLCLGLLQAVRIDALSIIAGVSVIFAASWILRRHRRSTFAVGLLAAAGGVGLGLVIGFVDLRFRSHPYLVTLRSSELQLVVGSVLVGLAAVAAALLAPTLGRTLRRFVSEPRRRLVADVVAGAALIVGFGAWLLRSHLNPLPKLAEPTSALAAAGLMLPARPFSAHSLVWTAWYLGPLTISLAIIAAALLVRSLILRVRWEWLAAAALLAPETVLYLWRPRAHPDQLWVTRRLVVCAFPAGILLAFVLMVALGLRAGRITNVNRRAFGRAGVITLGLVAVVYPMWTVASVASMTEQHDFLTVLQDACKIVGPNAALVIVSEQASVATLTVPVPIQTWCGIPTAHYQGVVDRAVLERAASQWKAQGRQLWIGAENPDTIRVWLPSSRPTVTRRAVNTHQLRRPLSHRPTGYLTESFQLAVAPVPTG